MSQPEDSMENLYILRFTRCPREFRDALLEGPLLQDCQESMKSVGLQAEMPTGSKIFCKPGLHSNALEAVKSTFPDMQDALRPYHVIVTEELRSAVLEVVNGLPRSLKVKCKEESVIARISETQVAEKRAGITRGSDALASSARDGVPGSAPMDSGAPPPKWR